MSRSLVVPWCVAVALAIGAQTLAQRTLPGGGLKAFVNARLIDGTGGPAVDNAVLLVNEGRVQAAGAAARVTVPVTAQRVNVEGRVIVPGFINAHGHVGETQGLKSGAEFYTAENVAAQLGLYARYGITTVFSLGGDEDAGMRIRDAQDTVALDHARLFVAGPVLNPKTPDEARQQVANLASRGVDIVKIRVDDNLGTGTKMPEPVYRALIEEAHARKLRVAVHLYYLADAKAVVRSGADFIAHSIRDTDVDAELIGLLKSRDICVCPTLAREVSTFVYESIPAFFSDPFFLREVDRSILDQLSDPQRQATVRASKSAQQYKASLEVAMRNLKVLSDAGVRIALGTDTGPPGRFQGYFEHMEMDLMARAGLTPAQILRAATSDAASCMLVADTLGTLTPGRWADFLVLDADPLQAIANARQINSVWIAGNRIERPTNPSSQN